MSQTKIKKQFNLFIDDVSILMCKKIRNLRATAHWFEAQLSIRSDTKR